MNWISDLNSRRMHEVERFKFAFDQIDRTILAIMTIEMAIRLFNFQMEVFSGRLLRPL